jgi:adenine-specific DNA-methyltransferase
VPVPDLFFTYMSHRYPRLIENRAKTTLLNSMHGIRLGRDALSMAKAALPLLSLNTLTLLGAEIHGRSYGGGILKMEPREAGQLPVPSPAGLATVWPRVRDLAAHLEGRMKDGAWEEVLSVVDRALLTDHLRMSDAEVKELDLAVGTLRNRRLGR